MATCSKPSKPYPEFPLFPHATGRWAKKIRGKFVYFGPWRDPNGALEKYLDQKDDLHAGRDPARDTCGRVSVKYLVDHFLTSKKRLFDTGELAALTYRDYKNVGVRLAKMLGRQTPVESLRPVDFEKLRAKLASSLGPVSVANYVTRIRSIFKYGHDAGLLDTPIRFGPHFRKPSERVLRHARHERGPLMFSTGEVRRMLAVARPQLRAMILLGVNCGFGNTDVATVPRDAFSAGWVDFPRPKTANPRRCPLWAETVKAIDLALPMRPEPRETDDAGLAFLTARGLRWARTGDRPLSAEFRKLLDGLDLHRPGLGFYSLRRTFETVAGDSLDQVAVDFIMGHIAETRDMSARYRQRITDARLLAVTAYVESQILPVPRVLVPNDQGSA